jgi:hypothetical protein
MNVIEECPFRGGRLAYVQETDFGRLDAPETYGVHWIHHATDYRIADLADLQTLSAHQGNSGPANSAECLHFSRMISHLLKLGRVVDHADALALAPPAARESFFLPRLEGGSVLFMCADGAGDPTAPRIRRCVVDLSSLRCRVTEVG